jgi:type II secretory pathway pseudopilin PulG
MVYPGMAKTKHPLSPETLAKLQANAAKARATQAANRAAEKAQALARQAHLDSLPSSRHARMVASMELISEGASVRKACAGVGLSRSEWWRQVNDTTTDLWERYARARECQAEAWGADLRDEIDAITPANANAQRVRLDAMFRLLGKLHPKVWGEYAGREAAQSLTVYGDLHLAAMRAPLALPAPMPAILAAEEEGPPSRAEDGAA